MQKLSFYKNYVYNNDISIFIFVIRNIYMFMFVFYQFSINQNFLHNKFMLKMKKSCFVTF